ncbi:MAG: hypothetical protein EBU07_19295, partial [Betaproteobacteria bacterium]|nr:hypothetical protein [Betaproteobacteria bacterium]
AVQAELVVGGDGIKSVVRQHVVDAEPPVFTGQVAWRLAIPIERIPVELRPPIASTIWCGPNNHAVMYYMRSAQVLNFVGCVERPWEEESWTARQPWSELDQDYAGWHPMVRAVIDRGWLRAPGAGSVAVRLEQVEPSLAGRLAAAFDFERTGTHRSSALAAAVVGDVANQLESVRVQRHVRMSRSLAFTATAATALAAWVAVALVAPEMVRVGLCRTLTPWTSDQWPARVALQVQSLPAEVGRGSSIELRAQVTRGDQPDLRVRVDCTVHGASSGERLFELARQPDGSFTRPVIAEGDRMTIRITADDAETDAMEILVRTPPSIVRGEVEITPPAYAAAQRPALRGAWQGTAASDPGVVLAGSQASVALDLAADAVTPGV